MNEYLAAIRTEMHRRVSADISKTNFKSKRWFLEHEWTKSQEKDFEKWLIEYLKSNRNARYSLMPTPSRDERFIREWANRFIFNYGWVHKWIK